MTSSPSAVPPGLFFDLDRSGRVPLYWQLAERMESAIDSGLLAPGARIENEHALGSRLALSQVTVKKAITRLVDKGLVVRRRGVGTVVVPNSASRRLALTSLYDDLLRDGRAPTTTVILRETAPADATSAARLSVPLGAPLLHLRRVRYSDGRPVAVLDNTLVARFHSIGDEELLTGGLYQSIRMRGTHIAIARQVLGARRAASVESELLRLEPRDTVLTMQRTSYDAHGEAIEFGDHCYRPDAHSFDVTVVVN